MRIVPHTYRPKGGALQLLFESYPEVLIEGPAGTGKTTAILENIHMLCEFYPGLRVLLLRETRSSLSESALVTYEDYVLPPDHPTRRGASRAQRRRYEYPNKSTIIPLGMDMPTRIMSADYDLAAVIEATETTEDKIEMVDTRLRRKTIMVPGADGSMRPWNQLMMDCNPVHPTHWLNKRPNRKRRSGPYKGLPQAVRILSRHEDNPYVSEEYLDRLRNLTGVRRARLYEGLWAAAEGMFWPQFDPAKHMVHIEHIDKWGRRWRQVPEFVWHLGSVDWGFTHPGSFQVWGITAQKEMYLVHEVYATEQTLEWWASQIIERHMITPMRTIVADGAEPRTIQCMNDRLAAAGDRRKLAETRIMVAANKQFKTGIGVVRSLLAPDPVTRRPKMFFAHNAIKHRDPLLADGKQPIGVVDEIPGYVCYVDRAGIVHEDTVPEGAVDHGCDALRYAAMYVWGTAYGEAQKRLKYAPGTMGALLGHEEAGVG